MARPTKYKKRFCKEIIEYFDQPATKEVPITYITKKGTERHTTETKPNKLPTVNGFCNKINIVRQTLLNWTEQHPEFLDAYTRARQYQEDIWLENGLLGLYNPGFAILLGKNVFGYKDKQDIGFDQDKPLEVTVKFVSADNEIIQDP
jgi:hypothetical protein